MPTGLANSSGGKQRGPSQWAGGVGNGTEDGTPYISFNHIPEGVYNAKGYEWAPEIRADVDRVIDKLLTTYRSKVVEKLGTIKRRTWSVSTGSATTSRTINVKSALPNVYNRLTANNFGILSGVSAVANVHVYGNQDSDGTTSSVRFSYNASSGILTINPAGPIVYQGGLALWMSNVTIACWYIE